MIDLGTAAVILGALATFGQFVYASAQTAIQRREEKRATDAALAVLNAEWFRLWSLAKQIENADLIQQARDGWLEPDDFQPIDQAGLAAAARRLGFATGMLTAYALTTARDAAVAARALIHAANGADVKRKEHLAAQVKSRSTEGARLLEDALSHSPQSRAPQIVETDIQMKSGGGAKIVAALKAQEDPKRRHPRWGRRRA